LTEDKLAVLDLVENKTNTKSTDISEGNNSFVRWTRLKPCEEGVVTIPTSHLTSGYQIAFLAEFTSSCPKFLHASDYHPKFLSLHFDF
jgi:hypothetical protein